VEDFVGNQFYRYFCENNSGSSYWCISYFTNE
jgi:hypothetical protein